MGIKDIYSGFIQVRPFGEMQYRLFTFSDRYSNTYFDRITRKFLTKTLPGMITKNKKK